MLLVIVKLVISRLNKNSYFTGWEPGTQYVYQYSGRSAVGIHQLKEQNAVIELRSRVIVQSVDQNTLIVKVFVRILFVSRYQRKTNLIQLNGIAEGRSHQT